MNQHELRLHAGDPEARSLLEAAAARALAASPEPPRLRVVLAGDGLPDATVGALVTALRRLRESGGGIEAVPATPAVADALAAAGLDRVFAAPPAPPARRGGTFRRLARAAAALFAAALVAAGAQPTSADAPLATPNDPHAVALLQRVIERNPALSSYQGRAHIDVAMTSFPFLRQHLDATTYYKKPSNYELVFDRVPSYAKGFEKLFADVGDPSHWADRFVITEEAPTPFRGRKDVTLRLVQRVRGMIDHETVLVDPVGATIDQIRYDYYNGGHITMTQTFTSVGGYTMLLAQDAEIAIPHARANAHGDYDGYRTNVAVDDAVFTRKN